LSKITCKYYDQYLERNAKRMFEATINDYLVSNSIIYIPKNGTWNGKVEDNKKEEKKTEERITEEKRVGGYKTRRLRKKISRNYRVSPKKTRRLVKVFSYKTK